MFSVSGWSITAPLKTQTEPIAPPTTGANASDVSSKKRKRKEEKAEEAAKKPKTEKVEKKGKSKNLQEGDVERQLKKEKKPKDGKAKSNGDPKSAEHGGGGEAKKIKAKAETANGDSKALHEESADAPKKRKRAKRGKKQESSTEAVEHAEDAEDAPVQKPVETNGDAHIKSSKSKAAEPKAPFKPKPSAVPPPPAPAKLTPLQASMKSKLASARFRHLNETLYTSASEKALTLFTKNPEMFEEYHEGFRQQVEVWPENPVDGYIATIKSRSATVKSSKEKSLPRTKGLCTIADLGCGDAKLAASLKKDTGKLNVKILSYDLSSPSPLVEKADISSLPLEDGSVNVAIFCLALMGTNWTDFVDEAYRILHWKGELWVAEIKSRFGRTGEKKDGKDKVVDHSVGKRKKPRGKMSEAEKRREDNERRGDEEALAVEVDGAASTPNQGNGGDETDVSSFIRVLQTRGFTLDGEENEAIERENKMFVKMRFLKAAQPSKGKNVVKGKEGSTWKPKGKKFLDQANTSEEIDEAKVLKPCVYKLR